MRAERSPTGAFSVAMVAKRWGTSPTFVYDQIKAGRLKAFKLGEKLIRITCDAVEEYEAAGALTATSPDVAPMAEHERDGLARLLRLQALSRGLK